MSKSLLTAGIKFKYTSVSTTSATHPASATWTEIDGFSSMPDFNPSPAAHEDTYLSDTEWTSTRQGLKSIGDTLGFNAFFTTQFKTAWELLKTAYEDVKASGEVWFEISVPEFGSFYFTGIPANLGLPSIEVDGLLQGEVYITPVKVEGWNTSSTSATRTVSVTTTISNGTATIIKKTFLAVFSETGTYTFTYNGTNFDLKKGTTTLASGVDPNDYGVGYTGTPASNNTITVTVA